MPNPPDTILGDRMRSRRGSVAVIIGLALTAIIGMVALGSEIVFVLLRHREMQAAADAAALGGATALETGHPTPLSVEAKAIASTAGFTSGSAGVTVTINHPPLTGPNVGNAMAVEAIVDQPQTLSMISLFRSGTMDVGARAVAIAGSSGNYCILALDPAASGAMTLTGNATVVSSTCGVADDSSSATALVLSGNAAVDGPVLDHGGWSLINNAALNGTPTVSDGATTADPYANVQLLTPPSCTAQSGTASGIGTFNLTPGQFCSGWNFSGDAVVNLAAGAYYIDASLSVANNVTLNGTGGVTLIVDGNYAISIGGNAVLNLTAQSTGNYAGIAIFGDRTGTASVVQSISGNSVLNLVGAIYFPNQIVSIVNNGSTPTSVCAQLIGREISLTNNVNFDNSCSNTGVLPIGASPSTLVE